METIPIFWHFLWLQPFFLHLPPPPTFFPPPKPSHSLKGSSFLLPPHFDSQTEKQIQRIFSFLSENGKIISFFPFPPGSHGPHLRLMLKSKVGLRIDTASSSFRNATIISIFYIFFGKCKKYIARCFAYLSSGLFPKRATPIKRHLASFAHTRTNGKPQTEQQKQRRRQQPPSLLF